ncbi:MAG: ATP-binding cassette domain-containing protein [Bacteroidales bacterium]|jgi:ABC-2 type transport system ATP-binding protein|nr:ATP-binding cassette domain-containing protein [Bacteroidales bacterium]
MEILKINKLTKHYGKLTAVDKLELSIDKGSIYGILGPNGSGKTTTLGMILNVIRPSSGSFTWFADSDLNVNRQKIGAIIETPIFYPYLSGQKNLEIFCKIKKIGYADIDRVLNIVELYERRKDAFKTYSLGMKQRLAIAGALLGEPEVLILDEPTNGLDPQGIAEIRNLIINIAKNGITIILASHLLDEVQKVCSHVMILKKGKKLIAGRVDDILREPDIFEVKVEETEKLRELILNNSDLNLIQEHQGLFVFSYKEHSNGKDLNQFLIENGLVASHLQKQEKSLESYFLNIIEHA